MPPDDFDLDPPDDNDRLRPPSPLVGLFRAVLYTLTAALVVGPGALLLTTMFNPDWESERQRADSPGWQANGPPAGPTTGALTSLERSPEPAWGTTNPRTQWTALRRLVKAELCDQGTHARVARCEGALDAWFTEARFIRYSRCVDGGGPTPVLRSYRAGEAIPPLAEKIETPVLSGREHWYLVYCDPSEFTPVETPVEDVAIVQ